MFGSCGAAKAKGYDWGYNPSYEAHGFPLRVEQPDSVEKVTDRQVEA